MARIWTFVRYEPLVHFVALAALLFIADAVWSDGDREVIQVDRATQEFLIGQRSDLVLRPLTPEEESEVIASHIEEEILWREAYKRGLDKNARMRRQLVQNMRVLMAGELPEPTEDDLRAFYKREKARFEMPPSLTLDHVFFADPDRVPGTVLAGLRSGADHRTLGDFGINLGRMIRRANRTQLVGMFGPDAARAILAIEDEAWHGPIQSSRGAHFFRITERHPPRLPGFEELRPYLEGEWRLTEQRARLDTQMEALGEAYEIVVEPREETVDD